MLPRPLSRVWSRGRPRVGMLRVLVYHRVYKPAGISNGDPHVLSATPTNFDAQIRYLARHYVPITAQTAAAALRGETRLPRRAVLVTFDDGYRDFLTEAWPVLKRYGVPALLFVPTAFAGTVRTFWWDELYAMVAGTDAPEVRVSGLGTYPLGTAEARWRTVRSLNRLFKHLTPDVLMARLQELRGVIGAVGPMQCAVLTWDDLRGLAAEGLAVGSHGRSHAALPYLPGSQLMDELCQAHADLKRELGQFSPLFSYPYGLADSRAVPTLRELGYVGAFISLLGRNFVGRRDPFMLYRHSVNLGQSLPGFAMRLSTAYLGAREFGRAQKAWLQQRVVRLMPA